MRFVTIDPGETTGYSVWDSLTPGEEPIAAGQAELWTFIGSLAFSLHVSDRSPDLDFSAALKGVERVIYEEWALYPWATRAGDLDWDPCLTARGIGAIEFICQEAGIPYAIMHGVYFKARMAAQRPPKGAAAA